MSLNYDGSLGNLTLPLCFQCFAVINNAAMNICTYTFPQI